jgi:hypothetical protein
MPSRRMCCEQDSVTYERFKCLSRKSRTLLTFSGIPMLSVLNQLQYGVFSDRPPQSFRKKETHED